MSRSHYLLTTEEHALHQFGRNLRLAFPHALAIFHCGSSCSRPDYRDVDVRIVLTDDEYDRLAAIIDPRVVSVGLSYWGQNYAAWLPVDCQIQRYTDQLPYQDEPRRSIGGLPIGEADR